MILGVVMTLMVLFIFPIILKKVQVPGYEYYTASNIFSQVSVITWGFLNLGKEAADQYQQWTISPTWPVQNPWTPANDPAIPDSSWSERDFNDLEL